LENSHNLTLLHKQLVIMILWSDKRRAIIIKDAFSNTCLHVRWTLLFVVLQRKRRSGQRQPIINSDTGCRRTGRLNCTDFAPLCVYRFPFHLQIFNFSNDNSWQNENCCYW
jgi:hypothetical protein